MKKFIKYFSIIIKVVAIVVFILTIGLHFNGGGTSYYKVTCYSEFETYLGNYVGGKTVKNLIYKVNALNNDLMRDYQISINNSEYNRYDDTIIDESKGYYIEGEYRDRFLVNINIYSSKNKSNIIELKGENIDNVSMNKHPDDLTYYEGCEVPGETSIKFYVDIEDVISTLPIIIPELIMDILIILKIMKNKKMSKDNIKVYIVLLLVSIIEIIVNSLGIIVIQAI